MMMEALVFNGASNLDFQDIRTNVVRIPEVGNRVREAQQIWDAISGVRFDLANFIVSDNATFLGHIKLKGFATAVVQVGLLDRFLKNHNLPPYIVGAINGDSPMRVAMGKQTFFDLVAESPAIGNLNLTVAKSVPSSFPILCGVELVEYATFVQRPDGEYTRLQTETKDADRMILDLIEAKKIDKVVIVGPGNSVFGKTIRECTEIKVQISESIDMDPMLGWFWTQLKESHLAIAN